MATTKSNLNRIFKDPFSNQQSQEQDDKVVETERVLDNAIIDINNLHADIPRN